MAADFDATAYTAAHTGRGRPDEVYGSDYRATVYIGVPANLRWVDFATAGLAALALKGLRKALAKAATKAEWDTIADRWYAGQ